METSDFYVNGDVAPGGRFMFQFNTKPVKNADVLDKETKKEAYSR